jgi:hypothetical protein
MPTIRSSRHKIELGRYEPVEKLPAGAELGAEAASTVLVA